ncbi:hypothetical protein A3J15_00330 [Candidatus Roizmanbacteria bacterium RIFCSPLOWO2_02_FULL_38_10]|uniref:Uncharacterized protein n=1 Tax=Candidatus Roizmanbacteria bacterium RIFCSPLOWO2_02_FULL_38_10 TaxID=1802074 RepID=A0A1F7JK87_9BACT|nr:MAG: hypothetical protein A3J15_00330 [Candidatus Roizmanbacteria bacterium RIFCSPLOWO2_02_FULL_38_10]
MTAFFWKQRNFPKKKISLIFINLLPILLIIFFSAPVDIPIIILMIILITLLFFQLVSHFTKPQVAILVSFGFLSLSILKVLDILDYINFMIVVALITTMSLLIFSK